MKKYIFQTILFLFFSIQANAQLDSIQGPKIDSLFIGWNVPNHPGGAVAIMKDGNTIYSKAYGLASLEYLAPNSTGTIFNIASVSKQFTAMGIVLLEEQGKLAFDDDIHKYIPELPDFGETITIRHLLQHTSGLRSLHALFALAGWRDDDSRTNEDLNRIILDQKDLNFTPGSEFLYCNTGYMLMVNIIENVTGEKFKDWMKENVFNALDMSQSYVEDLYSRVVANNATSYYGGDNFERAVEYWGYIGSGNMHSTTSDLLKWLSNFNTPQEGWESAFKKMQTIDTLSNGAANNYAFGIVADEHLGNKRIQHGGAIGGFRSFIATYPDENLSVVVLTNFSGGSPVQNSNKIAEIILGNGVDDEDSVNEQIGTIKLSTKALSKYEGTYWNSTANYSRKIYLKDDTLRYSRSENSESPIVPIGEDEFQMLEVPAILNIKFEMKGSESIMIVTVNDGEPNILEGYTPTDPGKEELALYTGKFYSPEIETTYIISLVNDTLSCHHIRHGDFKLTRIREDVLKGEWPLNIAKYHKDENGNINGILVSNGRVRNLWFEKQE